MQKITIASIDTKTGTNARGPWTLVIVKDDTGSEFTSFDKKLTNLSEGAVIELEPEIKKGKINIKEWKLISEGTVPTSTNSTASQMSKEEWEQKDTTKTASIEGQNALTNACNLIIADKITIGAPFFSLLEKKVMAYLAGKLSGKAPGAQTAPQPDNSTIKDVGDLLTRCAKIKIVKARLLELVGVSELSEITDLQMAWSKAQADVEFNNL